MSLSDERLLILKMLEEGKITGEEAARLLEALESGQKQTAGENNARQQQRQQPPNFQDEIFRARDRVKDWSREFKNNYNQKDFDVMVEEFSTKAEKLGKNLAATTVGIVDRMIDFVGSFVDTNAFNVFGSYATVDRSFEAEAAEGMDLYIEGINGNIIVKKHTENKVIIKSRVRSPQNNADSILVFSAAPGIVSMKLNKIGNISVAHEIYLPVLKYKNIKLETVNGKIYVEDTAAESFEGATRNSHIDLMGVNSDKISVSTKNARIQLGYITGKDIDINTNNSVIDIKHVKVEKLKAATMNGRILVENVQSYDNSQLIDLYLKTANGGIKVNMDDMDSKGYKVKARTTNGGINLLIPNITYKDVNRRGPSESIVEAESTGFDGFPDKVYITAETMNGYIEIVK